VRVEQRTLVARLIALSGDADAAPWVRSRVDTALADLLGRLDQMVPLDAGERAHVTALTAEIGRYLARPATPREPAPTARPEPPGEPIGAGLPADPAACDFDPGTPGP